MINTLDARTARPLARRRIAPSAFALAAAAATGLWAIAPAFADDRTSEPVAQVASEAPAWMRLTPAAGDDLAALTNVYRQHIETLADPFMEGRAPGTKGNRVAADYVEFHFRRLGLAPAFPSEAGPSFRQVFEAPASSRPGDSVVKEREAVTAGGVNLQPGVDFEATLNSASTAFTGPLRFAGYAIAEGEDGYSSFPEGTPDNALEGAIAVIFRFEPMNDDGSSRWATERWSARAAIDPKIRLAIAKGAKGVIIVNPPNAKDDRAKTVDGWSISSRRTFEVPIVLMSPEGADRLLSAARNGAPGPSILDLRRRADQAGGVEDLGGSATIDVAMKRVPLMTDNVAAVLPGRGPLAGEYVVIGAHYDHVGYGYFGSRDGASGRGIIHPGADDNASGTAGMLVAARILADAYRTLPQDTPLRSILFIGFCAEESGLNGSRYYAQNPIASIEAHQAMINLDMIGRLREGRLEAHGVGTAKGFLDWLTPFFNASGLTVGPRNSGVGPSDHASFANAGIPVLFLHTGLHAEYHRTIDTADTINVEGGAVVSDLAARLALALAARDKLEFTSARGRLSDAENTPNNPNDPARAHGEEGGIQDPNQPQQRMGGVSVRFGIAPGDYSGDEPGVLVGEVMDGLPAALAGLKAGDRMISWNGTKIEDVESWMPLLATHKPGDKVTIVYVRDGKEATTTAELVARGATNQ
jgi:hypothetical protein